eukprot:1187326-Prorocentrum_minimum.AAC.3
MCECGGGKRQETRLKTLAGGWSKAAAPPTWSASSRRRGSTRGRNRSTRGRNPRGGFEGGGFVPGLGGTTSGGGGVVLVGGGCMPGKGKNRARRGSYGTLAGATGLDEGFERSGHVD